MYRVGLTIKTYIFQQKLFLFDSAHLAQCFRNILMPLMEDEMAISWSPISVLIIFPLFLSSHQHGLNDNSMFFLSSMMMAAF